MSRRRTIAIAAPLGAVLAIVGVVACGGRNANDGGPRAVADRGRATSASDAGVGDQGRCNWKGRDDREVSETSGPGAILPNVRRVYQILGSGEDRRKVLICREVDTNLDGIKDVVRVFNEKGEAVSEEADANYDGKIDTWISFSSGRISKVSIDTDFDGQPDVWKYYVGGQLSRIQRSTNMSTTPDVWEFYTQGRLERMGEDLDHDGHVDRWLHDDVVRRVADAKEKAEERSAGGARVDPDAGAPATPPADSADGGAAADAGAAASASGAKTSQQRDKEKQDKKKKK
jgi:hypothetical protein